MRKKVRGETPVGLSKYAQKKRAERLGEKDPYHSWGEDVGGDNKAPFNLKEWPQILPAKITLLYLESGYLFLQLIDGTSVFMGRNIAKKRYPNLNVLYRGMLLHCEIDINSNRKGLQVTKIVDE